MGILFSRPKFGNSSMPPGSYPAGAASSLTGSTIAPFLGINAGVYGDQSYDHLPPIPFEWIVSPDTIDDASVCPDASKMVTLFGVAEAVIALFTLLFAYRPFVHWISRGYLGRRVRSSVLVTWTVVFVLQLLANAIIAGMVGNTPGYGHLNMLRLFTVYMARPRFNLVILALLRCLVAVKRNRSWDKTNIVKNQLDDRVEFPYTDAFIAVAVAELLLDLIAAVFTGVTWNRVPARLPAREYMQDMTSFVSSTPALLLLCVVAFVPVFKRYGDALPLEGRRYDTGRHWGVSVARDGRATVRVKNRRRTQVFWKRAASAVAAAVLMGYIVLVQWAYWTRFLALPGVLFCPPKMIETGVIWTIFSVAGIFVGAAS